MDDISSGVKEMVSQNIYVDPVNGTIFHRQHISYLCNKHDMKVFYRTYFIVAYHVLSRYFYLQKLFVGVQGKIIKKMR